MRAPTATSIVCIVLFALVLTAVPMASPALAQEDPATPTSEPAESPGIIPDPGSGSAPEDAGDRGGLLQTALFALIIGAIGAMVALIVRESRRARDRRGF